MVGAVVWGGGVDLRGGRGFGMRVGVGLRFGRTSPFAIPGEKIALVFELLQEHVQMYSESEL